MTDWFIRRDNDRSEDEGPIRPKELLSRVRSGHVTSKTMIRKDDSPWFEAGQVGGLFEAARRPTIEYLCPQCEREVTEPPVTCLHCGREIRQAITKITENTIATLHEVPSVNQSVRGWLQRKRLNKGKKNGE